MCIYSIKIDHLISSSLDVGIRFVEIQLKSRTFSSLGQHCLVYSRSSTVIFPSSLSPFSILCHHHHHHPDHHHHRHHHHDHHHHLSWDLRDRPSSSFSLGFSSSLSPLSSSLFFSSSSPSGRSTDHKVKDNICRSMGPIMQENPQNGSKSQ